MLQRHLFRLSSAIVLTGLLTCAQAVELGEPLVRSHIGQPLAADIELTGIVNDTATVQAALADPDVYRGASIAMNPALSMLNIAIVRRDGRRFLRIASPKAVNADYVHLFFALTENGRQSIRGTTLWLTPDPNPAPPPKPVPAPVALPAPLALPSAAAPRPAIPVVRPPAPAIRPPVASVPRVDPAKLAACSALDTKNAALNARIVELEDKVKVLTIAMQAAAEPAPAPRPAARPALPKPAPAKPAEHDPAKPAGNTPWLFIGIAGTLIAALVGALAFILLRKRGGKKKGATGLKARALIVSVRDRLLPPKKAAPEAGLAAE